MGLAELEDLSLSLIASKLGPKDAAVLACVNKRLRVSASEETLWRIFCSIDLQLSAPLDPSGDPAPSFKVAYQLWREAFNMYPWPLIKRVKKCWDSLKDWVSLNFPEAITTLRKGASEAEIKEVEDNLGVKLPLSTKVLYRFCDGQDITTEEDYSGSDMGSILGLIGGYSFYSHFVNVYLLPLGEVLTKTKEFVRGLGFSSRSKYIVVAASSTYSEKMFFLNYINGQLYVGTSNLFTDGEMMPCVSAPAISQRDAMLLWLEEHARRLQSGIIGIRGEGNVGGINLFPDAAPLCSTAITNGVQVRASAVFVPEISNLGDESERYLFAYSIRMSLLDEGCTVNGMSVGSCQLYQRHWVIRSNKVVVSSVDGEAVIGQGMMVETPVATNHGESGGRTPVVMELAQLQELIAAVQGNVAKPDPFAKRNKDFVSLGGKKFGSDMLARAAERWIREIEAVFDRMHMTELEEELASHQLGGEALYWWEFYYRLLETVDCSPRLFSSSLLARV